MAICLSVNCKLYAYSFCDYNIYFWLSHVHEINVISLHAAYNTRDDVNVIISATLNAAILEVL